MRTLLLATMLAGCDVARPLETTNPESVTSVAAASCCEMYPGRPKTATSIGQLDLWVCRDSKCRELQPGTECTTLSNTEPTYCQVPTSNDCKMVYLEHNTYESGNKTFQTIYCF